MLLGWAGKRCGLEEFASRIKVEWNNRFTSTLGTATPRDNKILLAAKMWPFLSLELQREVLIHEACHLFAYEKYGQLRKLVNKNHGSEWREMMELCGYDNPPVARLTPNPTIATRYMMYCRCGAHFIAPQMIGRLKKGARLYCPSCTEVLRLSPHAKA